YRLVVARVMEGRTAPLEQSEVLVEVNRLRSLRETGRGKVEVALLELRNLVGAEASEPLKLRGDFDELTDALPSVADSTGRELAAGYVRYQAAARSMEIYRVGVRGQAGQNLTVIRKTYELGAKTLLDYIAEQRRYTELENDYINAILETYLSRVEIGRASASPELTKK